MTTTRGRRTRRATHSGGYPLSAETADRRDSRRVAIGAIRPMQIVLSGVYKDLTTRDYAILQDDVQRVDRDDYVAYVRVVRQRHPYIQSGTIRIPSQVLRGVGTTDADRNSAVAQALILWLQNQSMKLRFALRVSAVHGKSGRLGIRFEEAPVQSS